MPAHSGGGGGPPLEPPLATASGGDKRLKLKRRRMLGTGLINLPAVLVRACSAPKPSACSVGALAVLRCGAGTPSHIRSAAGGVPVARQEQDSSPPAVASPPFAKYEHRDELAGTTAPIADYGWRLRFTLETGLSGNNSAH